MKRSKALAIVGDVLCPGVDVDAWKERNRVPLFPKMENLWLLARSNDDGLTKDDIVTSLYEAFEFWFDSSVDIIAATENRAKIGEADNVKVLYAGEAFPTIKGHVADKKEGLENPPTIKANKIVYVIVSFEYRGVTPTMAWPCFSSIFGGKIKGYCPNNSDWALQAVITPTKDASPERTDGDVLGDLATKTGDAIGDTLGRPLLILAGVASILGVAYIVGKLK